MMCNSSIRLSVWLLMSLTIGCATLPEEIAMEKFDKTAKSYELSIRWSEYDAAATHVKSGDIEAEEPDYKRLENIEVSLYKVKKVALSKDMKQVVQTVEIHYFHKDRMIVKTLLDKQTWKYDAEMKRWFLTSGLPDFQ